MDKKEQRERQINLVLLFVGCLLVVSLLFIYRDGLTWFSASSWSKISILGWVSVSIVFILAFVLQYYFLMLLRYSIVKYLVLWAIPIIWLFNNGLVAMHRFLGWTTDIASTVGWIPLGDLLGCLASAIFFPLLVGSGIVIAIVDSSSGMLGSACYYAGMAMDVMDVSASNIITYCLNMVGIVWDLISNSFTQQVISGHTGDQGLMDFNLQNMFRFPYWIQTLGYSLTCLIS